MINKSCIASLSVLLISLLSCQHASNPFIGQKDDRIYEKKIKGPLSQSNILFNIYLPKGYYTSTRHYPVIYHLHGLGGNHHSDTDLVIKNIRQAIETNKISPVIVVFANGLNNSMWADSSSGKKSAYTNLVEELIPHINNTYRTKHDQRVIQGFSMGGYGAAMIAMKRPELFKACINFDGAIHTHRSLSTTRQPIYLEIFNNDKRHFNQFSPWTAAKNNSSEIIKTNQAILTLVGDLTHYNEPFRDHLNHYSIPHKYIQTNCGHDLDCIYEQQKDMIFEFIKARCDY